MATTTKTRKTSECPKCGHSLKVMKFKGEKKGQITCPDCGWRKEKSPKAIKGYRRTKEGRGTILGIPIENADHTNPKSYQGAPIPATRVYSRPMKEFKNCEATAWMLVNEKEQTVTHANTYNGNLKSSYDPSHYTYALKEKVVAKKVEEMEEVEVTDWPSWITNVGGRTKATPANGKRRRVAATSK